VKNIELYAVIVILVAISFLLCGCQESQQSKTWGQGETPAAYQELFGNSNNARLNFVQSERMDQHRALIYGLNVKDANGQPVRKRGLIERVTALEDLKDRVKKLEDNLASWRSPESIAKEMLGDDATIPRCTVPSHIDPTVSIGE
jgi:hypothetical protein